MKQTKHTPGPWKFDDRRIYKGKKCIADLGGDGTELQDANARLIAAAPEMIEALEAVVEVLRQYGGIPGPDPFYLDKLIAKARGE